MEKIIVLLDDATAAEPIFTTFNVQKAVIPTQRNASEQEIVDIIRDYLQKYEYIIGITSSGNGVAIYANKLDEAIGVPISFSADIEEAFEMGADVFDISYRNPELNNLATTIIERIGIQS